MLAFARNFERQFRHLYNHRTPLSLVRKNECVFSGHSPKPHPLPPFPGSPFANIS